MLDPDNVPEIHEAEIVTRYLMFSKWIRADQTIKHDAFIPPDDLEFSVTRLRDATDAELWQIGAKVAFESKRKLHGRANVAARVFHEEKLQVQRDPLESNPNHAKVIGWPNDKSKQMIIAKRLVATSGLRRIPVPSPIQIEPSDSPVRMEVDAGNVYVGESLPVSKQTSGSVLSRLWSAALTFFMRRRKQ